MAGLALLKNLSALKKAVPANAAGGTFNPLAALGGFMGGIPGTLMGLTQLEGSTPQGTEPSSRLREGRARYAGSTGIYGRYAPNDPSLQFRDPGVTAPPSPPLASPQSSSSPAAERAYQAEKSRVAQLTAQDPDLQRYEAARKVAAAPGATQEQVQSAEDIGMQIWAKANPQLAAKVQPGQSGYDAIQGTLAGNMARAGQGFALPQQLSPTPQGFPTQVPAFPTGQGFSSGFGQPNVVDTAKFQELLKLVRK